MLVGESSAEGSYYSSQQEVVWRFLHVIDEMNFSSVWDKDTLIDFARGFGAFFWNREKGRISKNNDFFFLKEKTQDLMEWLAFIPASKVQIFDLFRKRKVLCLQSAEAIALDIDALTDLITDLSDVIVSEQYGRPDIRDKKDALQYLIYSHGCRLVGTSEETISLYRYYAERVQDGSIIHEPYGDSDRDKSFAILNMPLSELKRRLSGYRRESKIVALKPVRPSWREEGVGKIIPFPVRTKSALQI